MFSVIIPLYNKEKYIQNAITSVLSQSFSDFELIIVNDGSSDSGLSIVKKNNDRRIRVISKKNDGVSVARNCGVENAQYELLAFLDADDSWHTDFLKEMFELIQNCPEAAVYSSSYFKVKNGKNTPAKIGVDKQFNMGYINYYEVYAKTFWVPVNCSFVVVRKQEFLAIGRFNPKLKFGEDLDLWLRLSLNYKFAFINKCLAYSNQDVEKNNRALGNKRWKMEEHVIFNLDYLYKNENNNDELKYLLDCLRIRSLHIYYRKKENINDVRKILNKIDFSKHEKIYYFYYKFPRFITESYINFKIMSSIIKQKLKIK
jgi:glycosyltransferase involved in cell wall biosynthesis